MKNGKTRGQKTKVKRPIRRVRWKRQDDDPVMNPATACCRHHDRRLSPEVARHAAQCMGVSSEAPEYEMK